MISDIFFVVSAWVLIGAATIQLLALLKGVTPAGDFTTEAAIVFAISGTVTALTGGQLIFDILIRRLF